MRESRTPSREVDTPEAVQPSASPDSAEAPVEAATGDGAVSAGEAGAPASEAEVAATRLAELEGESARLRDVLVRKQAEFENYRKRVERERQEFAAYAAAELIRDVLPVVDNLERALNYPESSGENRLREGVEITYRQFQEILKKAGLREVDALSRAFDPHVHEAVERVETAEHDEGTVIEVLQKGYLLRDRLLRPALVKVAKAPERVAEPAPTTPATQ